VKPASVSTLARQTIFVDGLKNTGVATAWRLAVEVRKNFSSFKTRASELEIKRWKSARMIQALIASSFG
jgi:hypothetical protein